MESVTMTAAKRGTSMAGTIVIWILRLTAAVILLQTLFFKFTGAPESIYIFTKVGSGIGLNFLEPWGRIGSGVMELIAAILLLWPAFSWLGSLLAIGAVSGAILFHLTILGIDVQGDHGLLFALAWTVLITSAINLFVVRSTIPFLGERLG
jgi:putative oxidoreductase